jgi:PAS domain S-box-containing protein
MLAGALTIVVTYAGGTVSPHSAVAPDGIVRTLAFVAVSVLLSSQIVMAQRRYRELQASERNYRHSEDKFAKAFRRSPALISMYRLPGLVMVDANETFLASVGCTAGEVIGRPVSELKIWEDATALLSMAEPGSDRASGPSLELLLHPRSGAPRTVLVSSETIEVGSERLLVVAATDITERKNAEAALTSSERRARELFENATDLIFITDLKGRLLSINPAAERASGYGAAEIIGKQAAELLTETSRLALAQKIASPSESHVGLELEILTKAGETRLLEVNTTFLYENGRTVAIQGIARDITERRRLEAQLRMAQKMDAIGQLAGGVAHDFNNLLHVIRTSVELAQVKPGEVERYLDSILTAADRAAELTQQLLAFSRTQVLVLKPVSLNSVVQKANKMLARLIGEDIELVFHAGKLLKTVHADIGQMEQVIVNLAVNARDAMPTGGKLVLSTRNVHLLHEQFGFIPPGEYVELLVSDTGIGMTPDIQAHAFEPFFTTKEYGKGTGLGLATVYGIVKQSGGFVTVNSEPGAGTSVCVLLPAREETAVPADTKRARPKIVRGTENILVVEDEEGVRRSVREILQSAGYSVLEASTPEEAISLMSRHSPPIDLLITDVVMPGCTGGVFAGRFRERYPESRVLFISGYTDDAIVRHGVERSEVTLLKKPFTIGTLTTTIRELLDAEPAHVQ